MGGPRLYEHKATGMLIDDGGLRQIRQISREKQALPQILELADELFSNPESFDFEQVKHAVRLINDHSKKFKGMISYQSRLIDMVEGDITRRYILSVQRSAYSRECIHGASLDEEARAFPTGIAVKSGYLDDLIKFNEDNKYGSLCISVAPEQEIIFGKKDIFEKKFSLGIFRTQKSNDFGFYEHNSLILVPGKSQLKLCNQQHSWEIKDLETQCEIFPEVLKNGQLVSVTNQDYKLGGKLTYSGVLGFDKNEGIKIKNLGPAEVGVRPYLVQSKR